MIMEDFWFGKIRDEIRDIKKVFNEISLFLFIIMICQVMQCFNGC